MTSFTDKVQFIWSIADLLRGPYKPPQYGRVILPLTVLRRLDCVLEPTKDKVLAKAATMKGSKVANIEPILNRAAGQAFHNTSPLDFQKLKGEPDKIAANLTRYIKSFSPRARAILDYFGFEAEIAKLDEANRLYMAIDRFAGIDLHPDRVPNIEMGYIFEELIRRFNEAANETAGDHFTPREVIRLMVNLMFEPDNDILTKKGIVKTLLDPACGTGGMLSVADEYLRELNPDARLEAFGQDHNPESYAVCGSDMLIKGQNIEHIVFGSSFTKDGFACERFDYMLANPPFGVEWKPDADAIRKEHETKGMDGRFGAGLPRINDGSLLFLQHMLSKMKPHSPKSGEGGTRIGIVFNGSPLFTGDAGSGESEIRRWILENDWLEAIVALPDQLFYNTGIFTYLWILTNRKRPERRGKVQLINAVGFSQRMRKSLNNKRNEIAAEHIDEITRLYGAFGEGATSKVFDVADFGYRKITIEQPLRLNFQASPERIERLREAKPFQSLATSKKKGKEATAEIAAGEALQEAIIDALKTLEAGKVYQNRDAFEEDLAAATDDVKVSAPVRKAILSALSERDEKADICRDKDGNPEPDADLRDYESVPLKEDIRAYFDREVRPHVPDAWINESVTDEKDGKVGKIGYEVPVARHFYVYEPPRELAAIESDIAALERSIVSVLSDTVADPEIFASTKGRTQGQSRKRLPPHSAYAPCEAGYLQKIPAHWRVRKLKYVARVQSSNVDKKTVEGELPVSLCNYVDVYYNDRISDAIEFMQGSVEPREFDKFQLRSGDVLITKDSEDWRDIAVPAFVPTTMDQVVCGYHLAQIRPNGAEMDGAFLFRAFAARGVNDQYRVAAKGVTRFGLAIGSIAGAWFPVPPLEEQGLIAAFLDRETARLDHLVSGLPKAPTGTGLLCQFVRLVHEYRSALITAAVSGTIDVRKGATA